MLKKIALITLMVLGQAGLAEACPSGLRAFNKELGGKKTCVLEGTYVGTLELTSGFNYIMYGAVWIGSEERDNTTTDLLKPIEAGKLVVNPGVTIYALNPVDDQTGVWSGFADENGELISDKANKDIKTFLSVTRDSQIEVKGTQSAPVLMTSAQGAHQAKPSFPKQPGDWGGLVINGKGKSNKCRTFADCTIPGEAGTGWYGGNDNDHNAGILQYLQVEYGGDRIDDEKELNGVTFNAVGLGTVIDNVAVLYNSDDCIEFFGGTATGKNIFCYKGEDDGVDTTDGARIFLQNGVVVALPFEGAAEDNDRHMLEADSSKSEDNNKKLRSHPVLVNFTFVGGKNTQGMKLRRGTDYTLKNSIMFNVDTFCLNPDGSNELIFASNVFAGCDSSDPVQQFTGIMAMSVGEMGVNAGKAWLIEENSPLMSGAEMIDIFFPGDDEESLLIDEAFYDVYDPVDYRGAIGQNDWTSWIQTRD